MATYAYPANRRCTIFPGTCVRLLSHHLKHQTWSATSPGSNICRIDRITSADLMVIEKFPGVSSPRKHCVPSPSIIQLPNTKAFVHYTYRVDHAKADVSFSGREILWILTLVGNASSL
jgi:hypothetical protein